MGLTCRGRGSDGKRKLYQPATGNALALRLAAMAMGPMA